MERYLHESPRYLYPAGARGLIMNRAITRLHPRESNPDFLTFKGLWRRCVMAIILQPRYSTVAYLIRLSTESRLYLALFL